MKPDLDAIRARWPDGRLANTDARTDVLALLAYVDELCERLATAERLNEVNNRIIGGLLSTIESMSTVDASYDDDEP